MKLAYIILIIVLTISSLYSGEVAKAKAGFYRDNIYMQFGSGYSYSSGDYHKKANEINQDIYPIFSNTGDYLNYAYSRSSQNRPYVNNGSIRTFRIEYGVLDNFGIGVSIRRSTYFISNFNSTYLNQSLVYSMSAGSMTPGGEAQVVSGTNINYLIGKEKNRAIDAFIGHAVFSYHTNPNSVWDRYISLSIGVGTNYINMVGVGSGFFTFGTRYFLYPSLYLYAELEAGAMQIPHKSHNFLGKDLPYGTLYETSLQVGIGVSGWEEVEVLPAGEVLKRKKSPLEDIEEKPLIKEETVVSPPKVNKRDEPILNIVLELKKMNLEDVELSVREDKLVVIFLHDLLFPVSSDVIHLKGEREIKMVTSVFNKYPTINFLIEGHTDDTPFHKKTKGKFRNNTELSEARAWEVHRIMVEEKLSINRLKCKGYGVSKPRRPNTSEENKRYNRRIEIVADKDLSEFPEIIELLKK